MNVNVCVWQNCVKRVRWQKWIGDFNGKRENQSGSGQSLLYLFMWWKYDFLKNRNSQNLYYIIVTSLKCREYKVLAQKCLVY